MPDLSFQITGVEAGVRGLTPLLNFKLEIGASAETERVQGLLLNAQIQLQCPQRGYTPAEKAKLVELFGPPELWGQSLRNRLWAQTTTTVGAFANHTETVLPVPCTYDLNIASTKYLYALESGDVSLLFLFSGSIFYIVPGGRLQVEPISWSKECVYRMELSVWQELMARHYPNTAWITLSPELLERLYAYKCRQGLTNWDEVIARLLERVPEAINDPAVPDPSIDVQEVSA